MSGTNFGGLTKPVHSVYIVHSFRTVSLRLHRRCTRIALVTGKGDSNNWKEITGNESFTALNSHLK